MAPRESVGYVRKRRRVDIGTQKNRTSRTYRRPAAPEENEKENLQVL